MSATTHTFLNLESDGDTLNAGLVYFFFNSYKRFKKDKVLKAPGEEMQRKDFFLRWLMKGTRMSQSCNPSQQWTLKLFFF